MLVQSSSAGSDMQVFDDPSIQNDVKKTYNKTTFFGQMGGGADGSSRLRSGLPTAP